MSLKRRFTNRVISSSAGRPARRVASLVGRGVVLALFGSATFASACGARTGLDIPPPAPPVPECVADEDCPGFDDLCKPVFCKLFAEDRPDGGAADAGPVMRGGTCVELEEVDCDDNDPCTLDECEPASAICRYAPATRDNDGDGFNGPRVGTKPGDDGSCGDDCDDTSELAFPGNLEVCDGVDNDCNGIVDDNATFIPQAAEPIRISANELEPAGPGGLAWSGESYAAIYTGTSQGFDMWSSIRNPFGDAIGEAELVTLANADSAGGPIVWVGDRYGLLWQDRRDGDYEVYFALFDVNGDKLFPGDVRLTFAFDFSVNVSLAWNGTEFIAAWQDRRDGIFELYGQRISLDGALIGSNMKLTTSTGFDNESPSVAAGTETVGVAWGIGNASNHVIQFQTYSTDLTQQVSTVTVVTDGTTEAVYPTVVWNKENYVIAWYDKSASPSGIYAAVVAEDGSILVPPTSVSNPGPFRSRYPYLRPLGDRLLLVYADDRDQNNGYELYSRMITSTLGPLTPETRLTFAQQDSIYPIAAFGPEGDVGILFRDDRDNGAHHVFFTRLGCVTSSVP